MESGVVTRESIIAQQKESGCFMQTELALGIVLDMAAVSNSVIRIGQEDCLDQKFRIDIWGKPVMPRRR